MSVAEELNENMTSEDITAYADNLVKELESGRKSDADIVADTAAESKPLAEKKSGKSSVEVKNQDEETGNVDHEIPEWLDDDVRAEASVHGIEDSELSEFASREELEKVLRFLDKRALDAGRKAMAESDEGKARNERGQFVKGEDTKEVAKEPPAADKRGDRYEVGLSADVYDQDIVDEFAKMRDHYESRLANLESHLAQVSVQSEESRFDNLVDSLGHADLFGKTGSESEQELERRRDLHVAVKAQMIGLEQLGRPAEFTEKLVDRVANMVFADDLAKKRLKQHTQKISRQSQLRQGGSPTRAQPLRADPRDDADRLYREMERS